MNILIHDLSNEKFQSLFPETYKDVYIISDTGKIRPCIGCFGCWIKTPGKCVLKDGYDNMGELLSKTENVTIISRCFYGCYSPFVKNVLDRSIPWLLPFFKKRNNETQSSDVLIFAFPLYVDSINSHLLRFLIEFENRGVCNNKSTVYCMINNGFYEGWQNRVAADIMKNWCKALGLTYGQTLGVGAGEMLPFLKDVPLGHGPNKNIGTALQELSQNILSQNQGKDLFISPNLPRFLWKIASSFCFWYPKAKKNGLKRKGLKERAN